MTDPFEVPSTTITRGDLAFPARGANPDLLPAFAVIPKEYRSPEPSGDLEALKWANFQGRWFSEGLPATLQLYPRPGINAQQAFDHLTVLQGCYGSKHEHKAAAVAWLASRWFTGYDFKGVATTRE
jgi:hypothetical protein